jgi:tRNA dimethylallyltransferase
LRERLRERALNKESGYLHRLLQRLDSGAAAIIHPNDTPKLIRAIEVCLASRQKMSQMWEQGRNPLQGFRILRIGLDPERRRLYERINRRAQAMFDAGLVEETAELLTKYGVAAGPLSSLGYKQAAQLLQGEISRDRAIEMAQQAHRNYAKRQMTWFRREPEVNWLRGFGDEPEVQAKAVALIAGSLQGKQTADPSLRSG